MKIEKAQGNFKIKINMSIKEGKELEEFLSQKARDGISYELWDNLDDFFEGKIK